jgi:hypothetical protein
MSYDSHGNQICLLSSEIFLFIAQLDGLIYQGNHCILVSILLLDIINFEVFYLYAFSCVMYWDIGTFPSWVRPCSPFRCFLPEQEEEG